MTKAYELITNGLQTIASRRREDDALQQQQIAKLILDKGVEKYNKCMSLLTAHQIMAISKGVMREATREVYYKFEAVRRKEEEAVAGRGVNGIENPLVDVRTETNDGEEFNPWAEALEFRDALDEVMVKLSLAYAEGAKVVLGWLNDPARLQLPYYSSQNEDGNTWYDCMTFEEACQRITSDRARYKEQKAQEAKASLAALANADF